MTKTYCFSENPNGFCEMECSFFEVVYGFRILNFGHWNLFGIFYLRFVIFYLIGI
jgi:hypothetical protein